MRDDVPRDDRVPEGLRLVNSLAIDGRIRRQTHALVGPGRLRIILIQVIWPLDSSCWAGAAIRGDHLYSQAAIPVTPAIVLWRNHRRLRDASISDGSHVTRNLLRVLTRSSSRLHSVSRAERLRRNIAAPTQACHERACALLHVCDILALTYTLGWVRMIWEKGHAPAQGLGRQQWWSTPPISTSSWLEGRANMRCPSQALGSHAREQADSALILAGADSCSLGHWAYLNLHVLPHAGVEQSEQEGDRLV
jgi:hypothetical protein